MRETRRLSSYQPPPPPPPDDPPLLLLPELLDPPLSLELLELGGAIGAARPAAAVPHEAPPPPPPERPPAKPVHVPDEDPLLVPELNEPDVVALPPKSAGDEVARSADQSSISLPSPNARTHGNHSSRNAGWSLASSAM